MAAWTYRQFAGKAAQKIVPLRSRIPCWKGLGADSEEKREPVSDFNAAVVDSLKVLDPNGRLEKLPFRHAHIGDYRILNPVRHKFLADQNKTRTPSPPIEVGEIRL